MTSFCILNILFVVLVRGDCEQQAGAAGSGGVAGGRCTYDRHILVYERERERATMNMDMDTHLDTRVAVFKFVCDIVKA